MPQLHIKDNRTVISFTSEEALAALLPLAEAEGLQAPDGNEQEDSLALNYMAPGASAGSPTIGGTFFVISEDVGGAGTTPV